MILDAFLDIIGHRKARRGSAGSGRVSRHVHLVRPDFPDEIDRCIEFVICLPGKPDNQVSRKGDIRVPASECGNNREKIFSRKFLPILRITISDPDGRGYG